MKGLDGIQGPIYVGTGCVFRRQALYGFDAPVEEKPPGKTCNCWPKWCFFCGGSKRKNSKSNHKQEEETKKKRAKHREASTQVHALDIFEEHRGEYNIWFIRMFLTSSLLMLCYLQDKKVKTLSWCLGKSLRRSLANHLFLWHPHSKRMAGLLEVLVLLHALVRPCMSLAVVMKIKPTGEKR